MKQIQKPLAAGDADAAVEQYLLLLKSRPKQTGEVAKAVTQLLLAEYERMRVAEVHAFCDVMGRKLPGQIYDAMMKLLGPRVERTKHWIAELEGVTRERLGREARAAVTLNQPKEAVELGAALLRRAPTSKARARLGQFYIEALLGLGRDKDRCRKIIEQLEKDSAAKEFDLKLVEAFDRAAEAGSTGGLESNSQAWTTVRDGAALTIRDHLPVRSTAGNPSDEEVAGFVTEMTAVLRAGLADPEGEALVDALAVEAEFCPADPPEIASVAGVEPRIFLNLGPKARLTAVRGLAKLGENEALRREVIKLAGSDRGARQTALLATAMGGLKHEEFQGELEKAFKRAKGARGEDEIIDALGRLASPKAAELLVRSLGETVKKMRKNPKFIRRAKVLITAQGRITRARGLDSKRRNEIVGKIITIIKGSESSLIKHTINRLFSNRVGELDQEYRDWAAAQATTLMFRLDLGDDMASARNSQLGHRAPMVTALTRLGKESLPAILDQAQRHATEYGGAFEAFGEVMIKIGDQRAASLLDAMLRTSFLHDPETEAKSKLRREMVRDVATEEMREIDKDDVLLSLFHALKEIGGEEQIRTILGYADQIQAGQLTPPGEKTSGFLVEMKRQHGTLGKREKAPEDEAAPGETFSDKEIEKAASAAKGGMFGKTANQVMGLALLGRARRADTVDSILRALHSKEAIVVNAAETALEQFVNPAPAPSQYRKLVDAIIGAKKLLKDEALASLIAVMERSFPRNDPYAGILRKQIAIELGEGELAHRLGGAIYKEPSKDPRKSKSDEEDLIEALPSAETRLDKLQIKRQYLAERKKWLAAGKQGPEPPRPPGID